MVLNITFNKLGYDLDFFNQTLSQGLDSDLKLLLSRSKNGTELKFSFQFGFKFGFEVSRKFFNLC